MKPSSTTPPENDPGSTIRLSLGRLQRLEEEFRQHRDFWDGQAPYMRVILETTQALNQGLLSAVAALDRRQGEAIHQLSDRIDQLVQNARNELPDASSSGSVTTDRPLTDGQMALLSPEATSETPAMSAMSLNALMEAIRDIREELATIRQRQDAIAQDTAHMFTDLCNVVYGLGKAPVKD